MSHIACQSWHFGTHALQLHTHVANLQIMVVCGAPCRQQLWRTQLDKMVVEAMSLRNLLGLPDTDIWADEMDESKTPDSGKSLRLSQRCWKVSDLCSWVLPYYTNRCGWQQRWPEWDKRRSSWREGKWTEIQLYGCQQSRGQVSNN